MTALDARATNDTAAEIDNLICCLEFLASEADAADLPAVRASIVRSIQEIAGTRDTASSGKRPPPPCSDILQAFKFLARFCLIEDPQAKREIVRLLDSIDREALAAYAS